jgi:hypothetical protein
MISEDLNSELDEKRKYLEFVRCMSTFKKYEARGYNTSEGYSQVGRELVKYLMDNYDYDTKTAQSLVKNAFEEYQMKKDRITGAVLDRNIRKIMDEIEEISERNQHDARLSEYSEQFVKHASTNPRKGGFKEVEYADRMASIVGKMKDYSIQTRKRTCGLLQDVATQLTRLGRIGLPSWNPLRLRRRAPVLV